MRVYHRVDRTWPCARRSVSKEAERAQMLGQLTSRTRHTQCRAILIKKQKGAGGSRLSWLALSLWHNNTWRIHRLHYFPARLHVLCPTDAWHNEGERQLALIKKQLDSWRRVCASTTAVRCSTSLRWRVGKYTAGACFEASPCSGTRVTTPD